MNPTETAFLVLGLVIGTVAGAVLWQVIRARPAARREVRLTIAPNSVPARRASTLAAPDGARLGGPHPGSPDGDAQAAGLAGKAAASTPAAPRPAAPPLPSRTPVPNPGPGIPDNAVGVPIVPDPAEGLAVAVAASVIAAPPAAIPAVTRSRASEMSASLARSALAVSVLEPPPTIAARNTARAPGRDGAAGAAGTRSTAGPVVSPSASAGPGGPGAAGEAAGAGAGAAPGGTAADPCADVRRLVEERSAVADAARDEARRATDALRAAQREYDALRERVERAQELADPRRVADTKARLHGTFRAASDAAGDPDKAEAAAREWLDAINRLNVAVRDATRLAQAGGNELRALLPGLERLGMEAEAARISAENAADAWRIAQERLAACEEAEIRPAAPPTPGPDPDQDPLGRFWPTDEPALTPAAAATPGGGETSAIIRVLRGDRDAREQVVTALAGADPDAQREWHLRLAALVDAITARAIEDGYLDLPAGDTFWNLFDAREARDIVAALSALGFRYDGMGGFADERVPATRDLSLAVGYAGLDRMRIRAWPREDAMAGLYANATVACDEWLVAMAGDLTLGRMVDALGGRASGLTDLWNAWGRVRPVLLAAG